QEWRTAEPRPAGAVHRSWRAARAAARAKSRSQAPCAGRPNAGCKSALSPCRELYLRPPPAATGRNDPLVVLVLRGPTPYDAHHGQKTRVSPMIRRVLAMTMAAVLLAAAPARADITAFLGTNTTPDNRFARGVALGFGLVIIGFEFEY